MGFASRLAAPAVFALSVSACWAIAGLQDRPVEDVAPDAADDGVVDVDVVADERGAVDGSAVVDVTSTDAGATDAPAETSDSGPDGRSADADSGCPTGAVYVQGARNANGGSPLTIPGFDPGSCPNRLLLVGVSFAPNGVKAGVTVGFGLNAVTEITAASSIANGNDTPPGYFSCTSKIFYLTSPSGKADITVTFAGLAAPEYAVVGALALYGVNQTTPVQNAVSRTGSGTQMQVSVATGPGHLAFANDCNWSNTVLIAQGDTRWLVMGSANGAGSTATSAASTALIGWTQNPAYAWASSGVDVVPAP